MISKLPIETTWKTRWERTLSLLVFRFVYISGRN